VTPEEFAVKMQAVIDYRIKKLESVQYAHADADELLCEALRELGYGAGVDIYESFNKWYE